MLDILGSPKKLCSGVTRRDWLRIGSLGLAGLNVVDLNSLQQASAATGSNLGSFGKAKNVILIHLYGSPSQLETFDPKPDAPVEIRGEFKPIATNIPGIQFCELLPRTARIADKLAVVRSLHTNDNNHDVSGYWILTGRPYGPGSARQIKPTDWPYFGSILKQVKPSESLPALTSVWIPDQMRLNDNVTPAGQTAGFLGPQWDPERFVGDPAAPNYRIEGLSLPGDVTPLRFDQRRKLLDQVDNHYALMERGDASLDYDHISHHAFDLLTAGRARQAFDLSREPDALRDRYGRHTWGQSLLLSRRLIESGVKLVHVNWPRQPGDTAVDNPLWDTHAQNSDRLQDVLCPQFDVGFTTLIEDLETRGLLDETLVVAIGEFGRTPKINIRGGRDHWGPVFSFALAGAGIRGGQVYGSSDKTGGYPHDNPVAAHDLVATMFYLLGVDSHAMYRDRLGRPIPVTIGQPLDKLIGNEPATLARQAAGGDLAMVPPYDRSLLLNTDFRSDAPLRPIEPRDRIKGWRAEPLVGNASSSDSKGLVVELDEVAKHVCIGYGLGDTKPRSVIAGAKAMLTQEVRSPMAGTFTVTIEAVGDGTSAEHYRDVFQKQLACRLVLFAYSSTAKDPRQVREFSSVAVQPSFREPGTLSFQKFSFDRALRSQDGGAFELSQGIGVALVLEKLTPAPLDTAGQQAFIRVRSLTVEFNARPRDDSVRV